MPAWLWMMAVDSSYFYFLGAVTFYLLELRAK